jgi:hypothetical protein
MNTEYHFIVDPRPRAERRRDFIGERKSQWAMRNKVSSEHARIRAAEERLYGVRIVRTAVDRSKYMPHTGKKQIAKRIARNAAMSRAA